MVHLKKKKEEASLKSKQTNGTRVTNQQNIILIHKLKPLGLLKFQCHV